MMKRFVGVVLLAAVLLVAGWLMFPRLVEWNYLRSHELDSSQGLPGEGVITPENAAQIRLIEQRGWGSIYDVAWAPDSRSLALATTTGIRLVEAGSLDLLGAITTDAPVRAVAISPDGSLVAGAVEGNGVALWRLGSSSSTSPWAGSFDRLLEVSDASGPYFDIRRLQFSGDGRWVTIAWRRVLFIWEVQTGRLMNRIEPELPEEWAPMLVNLSPGQGRLFSPNKVQLYTLHVETGAVTKVTLPETRPESEWAAVGSGPSGMQLEIYAAGQDTPYVTLNLDDTGWMQLAFSADGQQLAALAASGSIYLVAQDGSIVPFEPAGQPNNNTWNNIPLRFSPDGQYLAWVAAPWALNLYRTADGSRQTLRSPWAAIVAVHLVSGEEGLMIIDEGEKVSLAPISLEARLASWEGDISCGLGNFRRAGFSADGSLVWLRQCLGCTLRETDTGSIYGVPLPCGERTALSPNGDRLAVVWTAVNSGDPSRVLVYSTRNGRLLYRHNTHQHFWRSLQFSPDGQLLLAAAEEGERVIIWGGWWRVFRGVSNLGWDGHFSPDGLKLVSGGRIVSLPKGGEVRLPEQNDYYQVALSPDGRLLARRSMEGVIELWDIAQVKRLRTLPFLEGIPAVLTFSADGSRLLVVVDGVMAFWGVK